MKNVIYTLVFALVTALSTEAYAVHGQSYVIEEAYDDKWFVVNGVEFEAKASCPQLYVGDVITFREGNPYGRCITATFVKPDMGYDSERNWCTLYCDWADY